MIMDNNITLKLTKRERDIAKILEFFYNTCKEDILDEERLAMFTKTQFPWLLAYAIYNYFTKSSEGWTFQVHNISHAVQGEEIVTKFFDSALFYNVDEKYRDFLKENDMHSFIPTDLETVD